MEEEDDYDDLETQLEEALAGDEGTATKGNRQSVKSLGLPQGSGMPTFEPKREEVTLTATAMLTAATESDSEAEPETPANLEQLAQEEQGRQKQALLDMMTAEQLNRYEALCRSAMSRKSMRRVLQAVTGNNPNSASAVNVVIVMCGVAKMFAIELVEAARTVAQEQNSAGPLLPSHIHIAFQRLEAQGLIPYSGPVKRQRL